MKPYFRVLLVKCAVLLYSFSYLMSNLLASEISNAFAKNQYCHAHAVRYAVSYRSVHGFLKPSGVVNRVIMKTPVLAFFGTSFISSGVITFSLCNLLKK